MTEQNFTDSPTGWVSEHVHEYVDTGGEKGHEWRPGVPTLLLTTVGRKSGIKRRTALIYVEHDGDYLIVASNGGAETPQWCRNLEVDPAVEIQLMDRVFPATAQVLDAGARAAAWPLVTKVWPAYDSYQAKATREIPVIALRPTT